MKTVSSIKHTPIYKKILLLCEPRSASELIYSIKKRLFQLLWEKSSKRRSYQKSLVSRLPLFGTHIAQFLINWCWVLYFHWVLPFSYYFQIFKILSFKSFTNIYVKLFVQDIKFIFTSSKWNLSKVQKPKNQIWNCAHVQYIVVTIVGWNVKILKAFFWIDEKKLLPHQFIDLNVFTKSIFATCFRANNKLDYSFLFA